VRGYSFPVTLLGTVKAAGTEDADESERGQGYD
jgi:hypothetical protein